MTKGKKIKLNKKITPNKKKSLSRLMAVQIFYQHDFFNDNLLDNKEDFTKITNNLVENYALDFAEDISSYKDYVDQDLLNKLVQGLKDDIKDTDDEISQFLKDNWTIEKLDKITLQILRVGTFELRNIKDVPAKVIIDEYVDIAASFFEDKKVTFVNAILDKLAQKIRTKEFNDKK